MTIETNKVDFPFIRKFLDSPEGRFAHQLKKKSFAKTFLLLNHYLQQLPSLEFQAVEHDINISRATLKKYEMILGRAGYVVAPTVKPSEPKYFIKGRKFELLNDKYTELAKKTVTNNG